MSPPPNDGAAHVLVGLLEARTGQTLSPERMWRIETALKPVLQRHGLESLDRLVGALLAADDKRLADEVVDAMLNNESYFFRDLNVFDELNDKVFEAVRERNAARRTMSIWMAGCSTGQEAYSIAMMLADAPQKWRGWTCRLIASDISHGALAKAKSGLYTQFEVQRGLSVTRMVRWFDQVPNGWQIKQALRDRIDFRQHNLLADPPPEGAFDIILCRNVLLYFTTPVRRAVFARLHGAMAEKGILLLGAGETPLGQTEDFTGSPDHRGFHVRTEDHPRFSRADIING